MKKRDNGLFRMVCSKKDIADIIETDDDQLISELAKEGRKIIREYKRTLMHEVARAESAGGIATETKKAGEKNALYLTEEGKGSPKVNFLAPNRPAASSWPGGLGARLPC